MTDNSEVPIKKLLSLSVQALRNKEFEHAVELSNQIISRQADHPGAYAVQFSSLFKSGQAERARRMGGQAAELNPKSLFILNNQACLQLDAKQPAAAAGLLKSLIEEFGESAQWLYNLALAQRMVGNFDTAITMFRRTLDHQAEHDKAAFQLADCLELVGHQDLAVRAFDYVRILRSKHAPSHSQYIHTASLNNSLSETELKQEMDLWGARFIPSDTHYEIEKINPSKPVKIGFVLTRFPADWLQSMVKPVINMLATGSDEISLYLQDQGIDQEDLDQHINVIDCTALSDSEFARRVRTDQIEVLVDLCGMRKGNRQRAMGMQLASRQYAWLGHEGSFATSNIKSLDEQLGRKRYAFNIETNNASRALNSILGANQAKASMTTALPEKCFATVGVSRGVSDQALRTWAQVLKQLPEWSLNIDVRDEVERSLRQRFSELGVNPGQIQLNTNVLLNEHSIVLDNFVCNDLVGSFQALQAQACVVALRGPLFPAQHTAKLFAQAGHEEDLCKTVYDYQQRAIALALGQTKPSKLSAEQLNKSGLSDIPDLTKKIRKAITS